MNNNIKVNKKKSFLEKILKLTLPHGIHDSFWDEIKHFSKKKWISLFLNEGFDIIKCPVSSGFGFGLKPIKILLEKIGVCSEYIYVLRKQKCIEK